MNYLPITVSNHLLEDAGIAASAQGVVLVGYGIMVVLAALLWTLGRFTLGAHRPGRNGHEPQYPRLSRPTQAPA